MMKNPSAPKPATLNSKRQLLRDMVHIHQLAIRDHVAALKVEEADRFAAAGGCTVCGGRGWVVVWDTMDSMSGCYAEYGTCPNAACTPITLKASGLNKAYCTKYDQIHGLHHGDRDLPHYAETCGSIEEMIKDLERQIADLDSDCRPLKGAKVVISRGRKSSGMVGVVAFQHSNGGYLIKDEAAWQDRNVAGTWINNPDYLEVIAPPGKW